MIVAVAGRRVDPAHAPTLRFPPGNVGLVRERVRAQLIAHQATALVSSAACGADLLALQAAGELGLRRVVVLPWDRERFRTRSVVDRGEEWGASYDEIVATALAHGDLRILGHAEDDPAAFEAVNEAILDLAQKLAAASRPPQPVLALAAWDGRSRDASDLTEQFIAAAGRRAIPVQEVMTV